ncbi:MAG: hypothetical protein WBM17_00930 [Anaerolineales bacterium]
MTQTPAAPVKKSPFPMILAIIIAAILSLCCCIPGILNIVSPGVYETTGILGENTTGTISPLWGVLCIGAAVVPWLIPLVVIVVRRTKK